MARITRLSRSFALLVAAVACAAATGCGPAKTNISGKVTYNGKPVIWGGVIIIGADEVPIQASLTPEGTYSAVNVPVGPIRVGVSSPDPTPPGRIDKETGKPLPSPVDRSKWFTIPDKFSDPRSSGLNYTADPKNPVVDIELK